MARVLWSLLVLVACGDPAYAQPLSYAQVLQRALANDAALQIARLELARARLETVRVESQLGWTASGQAGVAKDVNTFGIPAERVNASANLERRLESGSSVGVGVGVAREETDTTLFPFLRNPAQSISVDANYRLPLAQGADNVAYRQALESAAAGIDATQAELRTTYNQLARQVAELFYPAAFTYARLRNAEEAIDRAERLKAFVQRNVRLGVAEEKDRLQAEAQLRTRLTEQRALRAAWENQRIALNRLMELGYGDEWQPRVDPEPTAGAPELPAVQAEVERNSPELQRELARVRAAEAIIAQRRDALRDRVDMVFSVGGRRLSGDVMGGSSSDTEPVAGVRFEYRATLDPRGADAELSQAFLERDIARRRLDATLTNLRYDVARVVAEIEAYEAALAQARARRDIERQKLAEANRRYRSGRADTAELIQFENDYEAATLAAEQQAIELARRRRDLERLRGAIWDIVTLPAPVLESKP